MRRIERLPACHDDDYILYADDELRLVRSANPITSSPAYDVFHAAPVGYRPDGAPHRLLCGPECGPCVKLTCGNGPPPPDMPGGMNDWRLCVKKGWNHNLLGPGEGAEVMLSGHPNFGPLFVGEFTPGVTSIQQIATQVHAWMGPRPWPVVVHLYHLQGSGPLNDAYVAIPVKGQVGPVMPWP